MKNGKNLPIRHENCFLVIVIPIALAAVAASDLLQLPHALITLLQNVAAAVVAAVIVVASAAVVAVVVAAFVAASAQLRVAPLVIENQRHTVDVFAAASFVGSVAAKPSGSGY